MITVLVLCIYVISGLRRTNQLQNTELVRG